MLTRVMIFTCGLSVNDTNVMLHIPLFLAVLIQPLPGNVIKLRDL